MLMALGARLAARMPQRGVQTVTTNVPGPQFPLYISGRRMIYSYPYVPILGSVRISIAIFSYCGRLFFGITGDYDTVTDIDVLRDGIEEGMDELIRAASDATSGARQQLALKPRLRKRQAARTSADGKRRRATAGARNGRHSPAR